jgi:hypothetical protein
MDVPRCCNLRGLLGLLGLWEMDDCYLTTQQSASPYFPKLTHEEDSDLLPLQLSSIMARMPQSISL